MPSSTFQCWIIIFFWSFKKNIPERFLLYFSVELLLFYLEDSHVEKRIFWNIPNKKRSASLIHTKKKVFENVQVEKEYSWKASLNIFHTKIKF